MTIDEAREMRARRAAFLDRLRNGSVTPHQAVLRPPSCMRATYLWDILLACPGVGEVKAKRVCEGARVFPNTPMESVSRPMRIAVVEELKKL